MSKELITTRKVTIRDCIVGQHETDLVIVGKLYRIERKRLFRPPKIEYDVDIEVPYIRDPFFDAEYNTNRRLQCAADMLRAELKCLES